MFASVEDVQERLGKQGYICDKNIATVVFLADRLEKPVLVEGPAGVGKTELAKARGRGDRPEADPPAVLRGARRGQGALRVGVLEAAALHPDPEGEARRGDGRAPPRCARPPTGVAAEDNVFFSSRFIVPRPLLRAITSDEPTLLLIDEVDKSDPEFEAFLLEVLSDFQVSVPEIGTFDAQAQAARLPHLERRPRDDRRAEAALPAPLHRLPERASSSSRILETKVPGVGQRLAEELVGVMQRLRKLDLKKTPSISETLDWARALLALNATSLDEEPGARHAERHPQVRGRHQEGPRRARPADRPQGRGRGGEAGRAAPGAPRGAPAKKGALH